MQEIDLNIIPKGIPDVVNVSQFDVGRVIQFALYDGVNVYTIPSGATVTIAGRKGDNHVFVYEATIAEGRHAVSIETTEQMTAWAGENLCQLRITKTGIDIATVNFRMMVQERPDANGDISDSDLPMIIALATEQELNAEAWAVGTKDGTAVSSSDPQYHNNSKYYKEQAATSATNAANSATAAATSATNAAASEAAAAGYVYGLPNALSIDVDGNPIEGNFAAGVADKLIVDIQPIQDLHGYDRPWVGGAGKNECSVDTSSFSGSGSSWYSLSGASASTVTNGTKVSLKAGKHTIKLYDIINISNLQVLDSASHDYINSLSGGTFTLSSDTDVYIRIRCSSTGSMSCKTMLESGETAHDWESYSNICPISGLTEVEVVTNGKNIWDGTYSETGKFLQSNGALFTYSGWGVSKYIDVLGGKDVTISFSDTHLGSSPSVCWYDDNKNYISGVAYLDRTSITISLPQNARYIRVSIDTVNWTSTFMVEYGNTATPYVPYKTPNTYTIDLNGTRYGGTLDVKSGVMTVNKAFVEYDGSSDEDWAYGSSAQYIYITPSIAGKVPTSQATEWNAISNYLISRSFNELYFDLKDGCGMPPSGNIVAHISGVTDIETDLATIITYLSNHPLQFCYELETPITVQLDPETVNLLKGYNYITANGNTIMHLSAVPEKLINYIVNAFGTDESGRTTASRAYAAKEYFYKDGSMYKVTSAIAQGAAFTVGTNCVQTTIFAELTALNA